LVIHVTTTDISLELLLGPQLEAFAEAGFDVFGASAPGPYVDALTRRGVRHFALEHATRSMAPLEDARALVELVGMFRRLRPAIVHTHNPKPGLYGRIAARIAGVPVIVNTTHGLYALPGDSTSKRAFVYGLERARRPTSSWARWVDLYARRATPSSSRPRDICMTASRSCGLPPSVRMSPTSRLR